MEDISLPVLRNDHPTLKERLNDNAYSKIIPNRYAKKNANGEPIETPEELFERVAKNVAVAEAVWADENVKVSEKHIKPDHPSRDDIIGEIFHQSYDNLADLSLTDEDEEKEYFKYRATHLNTGEILLDENVARWVSYDAIIGDVDGETRKIMESTKDRFHEMLSELKFTPNSPTWMNAGDELQQLSACFVLSPEDNMFNIHKTARQAAEVFQSGGGMGYGFWKLRPYGDQVGSTGGIASGPITFMRTYDQMCETIAQGGSRRGAQMGIMRVTHPDIIQFLHAKNKDVSLAETLRLNDPDDYRHNSFEEALEEARSLINDGKVPDHLRNAAEGHLSNFNISVAITNEFMEAVKAGEDYTLLNPRTGEPHIASQETKEVYDCFDLGDYVEVGEVLTLPAKEIYDRVVTGAHENGEPGMIFLDQINDDHSFPTESTPDGTGGEYEILATNPCVIGDTLVATADGRGGVPIEELVEEDQVPVYTRSEEKVRVEYAENIRKTREDVELVEIETDGEASLTCTIDHPIWTRNRGWVEAGELTEGDSLFMFYETDHNSGYRNVQWTGSKKWNLEHRMVASDLLDMDITDMNVHHRNRDKQDNRPENLELMDPSEHGKKHARDISGEKNPVNQLKNEGKFEEYKKRNPFYNSEGKNNGMYGKSHSEETRRKIGNVDYDERSKKISSTAKRQFEEGDPVECLVCGQKLKALSLHLRTHDISVQEYREQFGEEVRLPSQQASNHKVTSVSSAGSADVYDLEVPETHNFFASDTNGEYINIHNCGEQPLMEGEACNLGHINLSTIVAENRETWPEYLESHGSPSGGEPDRSEMHYVVKHFLLQAIDFHELYDRVEVGTQFLDNVVTMSHFPIHEIDQTVKENRKIGLGIMGLAQLFVQLGVEYGSPEADMIASQLMKKINHESKAVSHELAGERKEFKNWEDSKYANPTEYPEWFKRQTGHDAEDYENGYAMRNHNTTTIAPTGTTSMLANTSGGCEPMYNVANLKNVSQDVQGDEMLVQFDRTFLETLKVNGFSEEEIQEVKDEAKELMQNNEYEGITSLSSVPDEWGEIFVTTGDLTANEHASIQCALQKGVDSAISKTINAPSDASLEDAKEVFEYVYDNGGKGVTYYRDGSRAKQVLTTRADNQAVENQSFREWLENSEYVDLYNFLDSEEAYDVVVDEDMHLEYGTEEEYLKHQERMEEKPSIKKERPDVLIGVSQRIDTGYGKVYVTINEDPETGQPFELFANIGHSGGFMNSFTESLAKTISTGLRSGVDPEELIEDLKGTRSPDIAWDQGEPIQSIPDAVGTALKRYVNDECSIPGVAQSGTSESTPGQSEKKVQPNTPESQKSTEKPMTNPNLMNGCPNDQCGGEIIYKEGCKQCNTCDWSKC